MALRTSASSLSSAITFPTTSNRQGILRGPPLAVNRFTKTSQGFLPEQRPAFLDPSALQDGPSSAGTAHSLTPYARSPCIPLGSTAHAQQLLRRALDARTDVPLPGDAEPQSNRTATRMRRILVARRQRDASAAAPCHCACAIGTLPDNAFSHEPRSGRGVGEAAVAGAEPEP